MNLKIQKIKPLNNVKDLRMKTDRIIPYIMLPFTLIWFVLVTLLKLIESKSFRNKFREIISLFKSPRKRTYLLKRMLIRDSMIPNMMLGLMMFFGGLSALEKISNASLLFPWFIRKLL